MRQREVTGLAESLTAMISEVSPVAFPEMGSNSI